MIKETVMTNLIQSSFEISPCSWKSCIPPFHSTDRTSTIRFIGEIFIHVEFHHLIIQFEIHRFRFRVTFPPATVALSVHLPCYHTRSLSSNLFSCLHSVQSDIKLQRSRKHVKHVQQQKKCTQSLTRDTKHHLYFLVV